MKSSCRQAEVQKSSSWHLTFCTGFLYTRVTYEKYHIEKKTAHCNPSNELWQLGPRDCWSLTRGVVVVARRRTAWQRWDRSYEHRSTGHWQLQLFSMKGQGYHYFVVAQIAMQTRSIERPLVSNFRKAITTILSITFWRCDVVITAVNLTFPLPDEGQRGQWDEYYSRKCFQAFKKRLHHK